MPGQLQTAAHMNLDAIDARTTSMRYVLDIGITGKLGAIGQSAFRAKAEELAGVFGSNVKHAIEERERVAGAA
jgi:carbon monoxide dehydrogenase subunit G